jgi:hypothetical protein
MLFVVPDTADFETLCAKVINFLERKQGVFQFNPVFGPMRV